MTSIAYYVRRGPAHTIVNVYAGPDEQHRAFAGVLTFRPDEAEDYLRHADPADIHPVTEARAAAPGTPGLTHDNVPAAITESGGKGGHR